MTMYIYSFFFHSGIGHSFRRTSATLLADAGADLFTLKRHGGWKSNSVAEGYVDNSFGNKLKISNQITSNIKLSSTNEMHEQTTKGNEAGRVKLMTNKENTDEMNDQTTNDDEEERVELITDERKTKTEGIVIPKFPNNELKIEMVNCNNCIIQFGN